MSSRSQLRFLAFLAAVCLLAAPSTDALDRKRPTIEVCADTMAYSARLPKAERKQAEEEARQEAVTLLALQLWVDAFEPPGTRYSAFDPEVSETDKSMATLLSRYDLRKRLLGGVYRSSGNKDAKQISYCVSDEAYREILKDVKKEREDRIARILDRFVHLESLIEAGSHDTASTLLAPLEIDVINEVLENTPYRSPVTDDARPLYQWLREWGTDVTKGPEFIEYMIARAHELMEDGYLDEADRYVQQAIDADRGDVSSRELRKQINDRRVERVALVQKARAMAENGRFTAAHQKLEEARELGRDDPVLLETAGKHIEGLRAAYLELNPNRSIMIYLAVGTLGADKQAIEDRVSAVNGFPANASTTLNFGAGANLRFGRWTMFSATGSWGFSQDNNTLAGQVPLELFEVFQLTASAGFRSTRTPKRKLVYQLTGGLVWEQVDVNTVFQPPGFACAANDRTPQCRDAMSRTSTSDSQTAIFARFAIEMKSAEFFIQQSFGFDDNPNSIVGWSDNLQIGIAALF